MSTTVQATKERPILFGGAMVRAILEGRKTQTRRVLSPQPNETLSRYGPRPPVVRFQNTGVEVRTGKQVWGARAIGGPINVFMDGPDGITDEIRCPYGQPGDRLWVRETWGVDTIGALPIRNVDALRYRADQTEPDRIYSVPDMGWKPSIHMPRWASRVTLEVTDVRVERLQQISESDALAEGVSEQAIFSTEVPGRAGPLMSLPSYRAGFACLWDSLNKERGYGWGINPWVWVIEFRRIEASR